MCKYHNIQNIDKCMKPLIKYLNAINIKTLASCCGHNKYPMTIVVKSFIRTHGFEVLSRTLIPRKKRFYKKDKHGYYYIPEVIKNVRKNNKTG